MHVTRVIHGCSIIYPLPLRSSCGVRESWRNGSLHLKICTQRIWSLPDVLALFELDENPIHVSEFVYTILQHGYAPLCRDFEDFYTRRLYHRIQVI